MARMFGDWAGQPEKKEIKPTQLCLLRNIYQKVKVITLKYQFVCLKDTIGTRVRRSSVRSGGQLLAKT